MRSSSPRMGTPSMAARDEEARPRRFPWLRALSPKNAETLFHLVEQNGLENTKVVLAGVTPGGEAKVAAQPSPRYRDADAGPWGYYPPPRGLFGWQRGPGWGPGYAPPPRYIASSVGAGSSGPRGVLLGLGKPLLAVYFCSGPSAFLHACKPPWIWRAEFEPRGLGRLHRHGGAQAEGAIEDQTLA